MIEDGPFGFKNVNVEGQAEQSDSLLNFVKELAHLRRERIEIGGGLCNVLACGSEHVLAHHYKSEHAPLVLLHNLTDRPQRIDLSLPAGVKSLDDLFGGETPSLNGGRLTMELEPYGLRWLGRRR
ncbi:Alpha-amylase [Nitratireductor thuwali]|uniref:Alpha-amylase n=1 Tax=Nitratireductor thuwali TaxID=2267699 RepID=A0ABY5MJG9_9HYPH|nr:Alpha-amylase [Nitratireductor thuwali]